MTDPTERNEQFLKAAREYVEKCDGSWVERLTPYDEISEEDWEDGAQSLNRTGGVIDTADTPDLSEELVSSRHFFW